MFTNNLLFPTPSLIFGCGYLGKSVASALLPQSADHTVYATTRSQATANQLAAQTMVPLIADWTDRRTLARLPVCDRVLIAVSYDGRSGQSREQSQVGGLCNLLEFLPSHTQICYISTTGVYHQTDGSWVDETSPARPQAAGGLAHLRAEELLHRQRPGGNWNILRLAGIYGPGRVPRAADVIAGRPLAGPPSGYLNLIHVADAAQAVLAAWGNPHRSRLYAVADDCPVVRHEFYEQIARHSGVAAPQFTIPATSAPAAFLSARSHSNKRIWNRRFRRELMPRLIYPSYIAGLSALDLTGRGRNRRFPLHY